MAKRPSTRKGREALPTEGDPVKPLIEIPEDEKWRLIRQSGLLKDLQPPDVEDDDEVFPLAQEIFNCAVLVVPFSFFLLMMEVLIHNQYGRQPSLKALTDRMVPSVPIISIFIFYTTRYKQHRRMQFFLFVLANLVGSRLLYLLNRGSWKVNMRQCPPLATVWVYTVVQLNLGPAVLNLVMVGVYVWWKGLEFSLF